MRRGGARALAVAVAFVAACGATAADLSTLYDPATLEQWQPRYERTTLKIRDEVILPVLLTEERQRLGVPRVVFPPFADGNYKDHPLAFYALSGPPRVVMPVMSLHFLDELCIAYAWLQVNGYRLETVSEYTAMLRYHEFPAGRVPPPLAALQIPANALQDRRVDELALGHFVTARTFLLLHEMGHIYHGHRAASYAESQANEEQADRFAAMVMKRTALPPLGMLVFFLADAHWSGYPSAEGSTHPLSGARLQALARQVNDPGIADGLVLLGELIDDAVIRAGFVATGKAGRLVALAPRRRGELPKLAAALVTAEAAAAFSGVYVGQGMQAGEREPFPIRLALVRRGESVNGEYTFGLGVGEIHGNAIGDTLEFDWKWAGRGGRGRLASRDGGASFAGTWGNDTSADNAGTWHARRQP